MKRIASLVIAACTIATTAQAQDSAPPVSVEAVVSASSSYVWRGMTIGNRPVVQPSVTMSVGGLAVTSWGNLWDTGEGRTFSEHDLTVAYARTAGALELEGGWTNYFFRDPASGRHSNEVFARLAWTSAWSPAVAVYTDVQEGSGTYAAFTLTRTLVTRSRLSVEATAGLGYNHHSWTETSGLTDAPLSLRADLQLTSHVRVAPVITASFALDPAVGPSRLVWGIEAAIR